MLISSLTLKRLMAIMLLSIYFVMLWGGGVIPLVPQKHSELNPAINTKLSITNPSKDFVTFLLKTRTLSRHRVHSNTLLKSFTHIHSLCSTDSSFKHTQACHRNSHSKIWGKKK